MLLSRNEDPGPDPVGSVDFWPAGYGYGTFSADPDPTCNNGFIKSFLSLTKYISESTTQA